MEGRRMTTLRCAELVRTVALTGCIFAATNGAARAQEDADAERVPVSIQLPEGARVRLRSIIRTEQLAAFGPLAMVSEAVIAKDITLTGLGVTDDGDVRVKWRFDRVWGEVINPRMNATFDSASSPEEPEILTTVLSAHGGTEFTVTFATDGRVLRVEGIEDAIEKASARFGEAAAKFRMVFERLLSAEKLVTEIEWQLAAMPLPSDSVAIGTAWEATDRVPTPSENVDMRIVGTRRVESVDAESITIGGDMTLACSTGSSRKGPMHALLNDENEDTLEADASVRVSRTDGFPLSVSGNLHLSAFMQNDDGSEGTFRQRSRFATWRLGDDSESGDAALAAFGLFDMEAPHAELLQASWLGARGRVFEDGDSPAEARREFKAALAISRAALATARDDGDWVNLHLRHAKSLAYLDGAEERWDAARAAWVSIAELMASDRLTRADRHWEHVHALAMQGVVTASGGDTAAASAAFVAAEGAALARLEGSAADSEMRDLLAWAYERWSAAADEAEDDTQALSLGVKALALRDELAVTAPRTPADTETLVNDLWGLHLVALRAGNADRAAELLDRARKDVEPLLEYDESFREFSTDMVARREAIAVMVAGGNARDATQARVLADLLYTMKRYAESTAQWEIAVADETIRGDFENANLYYAAISAALAHSAADGDAKARFAVLTIEWLGPHVTMLRRAAGSDDKDRSEWATSELAYTREYDRDFASMRGTMEFDALFSD